MGNTTSIIMHGLTFFVPNISNNLFIQYIYYVLLYIIFSFIVHFIM